MTAATSPVPTTTLADEVAAGRMSEMQAHLITERVAESRKGSAVLAGQLTVTDTGCHVWAGSRGKACSRYGTVGCCLIAHASPAAQRAYDQPRCEVCGRFMATLNPYQETCGACA